MWSLGVILIELAIGVDFVCSGHNLFDQERLVKRIHSRMDGTCRPGGVWYELARFDANCYRVASRLLTTGERRVQHWTPSEPMEEGLCEEKLKHFVHDASPPSSPVFYDALDVADEELGREEGGRVEAPTGGGSARGGEVLHMQEHRRPGCGSPRIGAGFQGSDPDCASGRV